MAGRIADRLAALGITLPEPSAPQANYVPFVRTGNQVFIAGQVSRLGDDLIAGKLGRDLDVAAGQKAARYCALALMAHARAACGGDLDRVVRWVKLGGFVHGAPDFIDPPKVVNGASDLIVEVFGDAGRHARFAIAVACLPLNAAVEIDAVVEVR